MARSVIPWILAGSVAAVIVYWRTCRVDGRAAASDTVAAQQPELGPRNASLTYRPIGNSGEPYPNWLRDLRGKSGVYVIRERRPDGATEIVYVGESHRDRLYQTLTRHFQTWRRSKKFWTGQYGGQGHDPGLTYPRDDKVTVAARVMSPDRAIAEEARLIARLRPRDNLLGQPDDDQDVIPF